MGLTRQLSNGLKFNRQPSKTVIFLPSTVKNAEKFQQNISNLAFLSISADFHGLLAPEDWIASVKLENQFLGQFSKTDSFYIVPLYLKLFPNFVSERPRKPPKHIS